MKKNIKLKSMAGFGFASLVFILICFFLPLTIITQNRVYFLQKFSDYQIYNNFSQDQDTVNSEFYKIQDYLKLKNTGIVSEFFSNEDLIHLNDVRNIYISVYIILIISITYLLAYLYWAYKKQQLVLKIYRISKNALIILIVLTLLLYPVINANFPAFFQLFHQILFAQGYWQLDLQSSHLIKYFLNNIFSDIFNLLGILALILPFITFIFSIILLKVRIHESK
ncbi:MAG TPA: DUF1461 domain-containing protein [Candidatus Dojkabacteria bacterium]|nr:DUF1461 domain-containing protein [Candidatus Dojkabacteria bacterium]